MTQTVRRLAMTLGQSTDLLRKIELDQIHPAMAAFGLWQEEADLDNLVDQVYAHRRRQPSRPEVAW